MARDPLAAARPRCRPTVSRRPAAGFHTQYRSPDRWQWSSSPTPDTHATGPVPGPPTRSTESAAGPRKPNTLLREDRGAVDFLPVFPLLDQQSSRGRQQNPPIGINRRERPPRCLESAHRACEIWSGLDGNTKTPAFLARTQRLPSPSLRITITARIRKSAFAPEDSLSNPAPCGRVPVRIRTRGCRHPLKHRRHPAPMLPAPGETSRTANPSCPGSEWSSFRPDSVPRKCVSFAIRLNALCPADRLESDWKFFEAVAAQVVEPKAPPARREPSGASPNAAPEVDRNSLRRSKSPRSDLRRNGRYRFPCSPK